MFLPITKLFQASLVYGREFVNAVEAWPINQLWHYTACCQGQCTVYLSGVLPQRDPVATAGVAGLGKDYVSLNLAMLNLLVRCCPKLNVSPIPSILHDGTFCINTSIFKCYNSSTTSVIHHSVNIFSFVTV